MVYMDDGIFLGNNDTQLQQAIKEIQGLGLNIEDQGHPADYVGVNIKKLRYGTYEFTQHALADCCEGEWHSERCTATVSSELRKGVTAINEIKN